jgi:hypothetical protein
MTDFGRAFFDELEESERWLAGFPAPDVPIPVVQRCRDAVRREAIDSRGHAAGRVLRAWHGGLAAAAMMALAVGVAWYAVVSSSAPPVFITITGQPPAAAESDPDSIAFAAMDETLADLESWSQDSEWDAEGASLTEAFDEAFRDSAAPRNGARSSSL